MEPSFADIKIDLLGIRKVGTYAYELRGNKKLARMACGTVKNASRHTLLAVGTVAALRTFTNKMAEELVPRGQQRKLAVDIFCSDLEFVIAFNEAMKDEQAGMRKRCARNIWETLLRHARRFDLNVTHVGRIASFDKLKRFSQQSLPPRSKYDWFLMPDAIRVDTAC